MANLFDLKFDPETRDVVIEDGDLVKVEDASTAVMHQMLCHFDEWPGDPEAGSRLHNLELFQTDPSGLIEDEAKRALQVLADAGRIKNITVRAEEPFPGRVVTATAFQDSRTGSAVEIRVPTRG